MNTNIPEFTGTFYVVEWKDAAGKWKRPKFSRPLTMAEAQDQATAADAQGNTVRIKPW